MTRILRPISQTTAGPPSGDAINGTIGGERRSFNIDPGAMPRGRARKNFLCRQIRLKTFPTFPTFPK